MASEPAENAIRHAADVRAGLARQLADYPRTSVEAKIAAIRAFDQLRRECPGVPTPDMNELNEMATEVVKRVAVEEEDLYSDRPEPGRLVVAVISELPARATWLKWAIDLAVSEGDLPALRILLDFPEAGECLAPQDAMNTVETLIDHGTIPIPIIVSLAADFLDATEERGIIYPTPAALGDALDARICSLGLESLPLGEGEVGGSAWWTDGPMTFRKLDYLGHAGVVGEVIAICESYVYPHRLINDSRARGDDPNPLDAVGEQIIGLVGDSVDVHDGKWRIARTLAWLAVYHAEVMRMAYHPLLREGMALCRRDPRSSIHARPDLLRAWGGPARRWSPLRAGWVGAVAVAGATPAAEAGAAASVLAEAAFAAALAEAAD